MQQNSRKTALKISIIIFYFVTAFYSLYYICMGRQMIKTTIETIETTGFTLKQRLRIETNTLSQKLSLLFLLSLKKNLVKTCCTTCTTLEKVEWICTVSLRLVE